MIPSAFEYLAPGSIAEAVALLKTHGDEAKILSGGHSLVPLMKLRFAALLDNRANAVRELTIRHAI